MKRIWLITVAIAAVHGPLAYAAVAQDIVTIGTGSAAPSATVDVPVFIRDTSGTPLGLDQPPGSRIQSYSIKVNYSPASAVQSVTFTRAGITAPLTPLFEASPSAAGTVTLLDTFQESTNLIPFTLNGAAPGNQVAVLHFTLAASATPGTTITLTVDPVLTQLTDQGGSPATRESVANANLTLVNGSITVASPPSADLSVTKSGPPPPLPFGGQNVAYTVTIANAGPSAATAVVLTDVLPPGTTLVSATSPCTGTTTVTCSLATLNSGASAAFTIVVTAPAAGGSLTNIATVSSATADPNSANNTATVTLTLQPASAIPALPPAMLVLLGFVLTIVAAFRLTTR